MAIPEGCPCDAVAELKETARELQRLVADHDRQLASGNTSFALIQKDLDYIKAKLDDKKKFNTGVLNAIINAAVAILLGYVALKLGLS